MLASAPSSKTRCEEGRREIGLAHAGRELRLDLGDGLLGDPQRVAQAGELVGRLDHPGRADHLARRAAAASRRTAALDRGASRRSTRRSRPPPCRDELGQRAGEGCDALVEVEVRRAVQVVVVEPELAGRVGEERREQVGALVVGEDDGDRAFDVGRDRRRSAARSPRWRRTTLVLPSRTRASTPWSAITARSRAPRSRRIRGEVRLRRQVGPVGCQVSPAAISASRPRNAGRSCSTILTAASGPTASTTRGERPLAVAVGALVVREVRRPHHPVDADPVDQLEAQRVDHERGVHVLVPVVLRRRARSRRSAMCCERRVDVLGVLDAPPGPS